MEIFPGVSMDPNVRFGKACLTGTRVDVATIVADLGAGETIETVQDAYSLSREQVLTALPDLLSRIADNGHPIVEVPEVLWAALKSGFHGLVNPGAPQESSDVSGEESNAGSFEELANVLTFH